MPAKTEAPELPIRGVSGDETAVARKLNHPHSLVSLSDAGALLTLFNDANFGLHLLGHWARDLGAMPLAEAVRRPGLSRAPPDRRERRARRGGQRPPGADARGRLADAPLAHGLFTEFD